MITVVNKYKHKPTSNDIYIGRGSVLGNPFTSIKYKSTKAEIICDNREQSIEMFKDYLQKEIENKNPIICSELNIIYKKAKEADINLVCFCKPKDCHGDIIKELLESKLNK